jgi:hypothetical protein
MNDFAAMMEAQGTRRLDARPPIPSRTRTQARPAEPPRHPPTTSASQPAREPQWRVGDEGLEILERAMRGVSRDGALRRPNGQIVMLVWDGGTLVDAGDPHGISTARELLAHADAIGCEMIVVAWDGRKAVFHPACGAAVLASDPR